MADRDRTIASNSPGGQSLTNEQYAAVIDEFSAAVAALAEDAPPEKIDRLGRATGNLLETLASRTTMLSAQAFGAILAHLEHLEHGQGEIERRFDRRQQSNADIITTLRDIQSEMRDHSQRIAALEQRAVGDGERG